MALIEQKRVDNVAFTESGIVEVREVIEIIDDSITPTDYQPAVYEQVPVLDEEGNETGEFTQGALINPEVMPVSNVRTSSYHRYTLTPDQPKPQEVIDFLAARGI